MSGSQSGSQAGQPMSQDEDLGGNGIGSMESRIQKLYFLSRVPGEDFVHCMSPDAFNSLEDFCSLQNIDNTKRNSPLLVVGDRGIGKSALLANWLLKRHRSNQRSRVSGTADEYVFYHAVGCTRQSLSVTTLLRRLITDIKTKCELSREVPSSQEKLRWELPRFLDLAAKRSRVVIIVIDGLHRLLQNEEDSDDSEAGADPSKVGSENDNGNTNNDNNEYNNEGNGNSKRHASHSTGSRNDINEGSLSWLPLEFASNVRVILSATLPLSQIQHVTSKYNPKEKEDEAHNNTNTSSNVGVAANITETDENSSGKKHRILQEMERRQWTVLRVRFLEKMQAKSLIEAFLHKSVHGDATAQTTGPFLASMLNDGNGTFHLTGGGASLGSVHSDAADSEEIPGFLLFECQINSILAHPLGNNPLFLRLFLRCAHYAARRGFSLWRIFDDWIQAESVSSLLMRIFRTFEVGFDRTREGCQADCDRTMAAGGLPALRTLYPWHPSFPDKNVPSNQDALISAELRNAFDNNKSDMATDSEGNPVKETSMGHLSRSVIQNLGDQKWQTVSEQATITLEEARRIAERSLNNTVDSIAAKSKESNVTFVDMLIKQIRDMHTDARKNRTLSVEKEDFSKLVDDSDEKEHRDENHSNDHKHSQYSPAGINKNISHPSSNNMSSAASNYESYSSEDDSEYSSSEDEASESYLHNETDPKDREETEETDLFNTESTNTGASTTKTYSRASILTMIEQKAVVKDKKEGRRVSRVHRIHKDESDEDSVNSKNNKAPQEDPSEDFTKLPIYMRGGSSVKGFGDLIGDALSLLYVARHGLKESELWSILATLNKKRTSGPGISKDKENEKKALISVFMISRSAIEDLCRNCDPHKTGLITRRQLLKTLARIHPALQKLDIANLLVELELISGIGDSEMDMESWMNEDSKPIFDYMEFLNNVAKVDRQLKLKGKRNQGPKTNEDDFDHLSLDHLVEDTRDFNPLDVFNINNNSSVSASALGPVMEEALLSVLCALGVIHSPDNQVIILPCDGSVIRKVIKSKYVTGRVISSEVQDLESWHGFLIRYCQKEKNAMRRCEELPWHLQICRNWTILRDTISDLDTFDMMYISDLREELLGYWLLLTEGPLFTSAEAEREFSVTAFHSEQAHTRILIELDTAAARGLSEKEARVQLLKGKVAPFDIIEELNASVEIWISTLKPSTAEIHYKINLIAQFLICYSKLVTKPPIFSRLGIDTRGLKMFNISVDEVKEAESQMKSNDDAATECDRSVATGGASGIGGAGNNAALTSSTKFNVTTVISGNPNLVFPSPSLRESNLYFYLRWIWLQFPWLALHHAPIVGKRDRSDAAMKNEKYTLMSMTKPGGANDPLAPANNGKAKQLTDPHNLNNEPLPEDTDANFEKMRFWNVKKLDPSVPIVDKSGSRKTSEVNSYLNESKTSLDALDMSFKRIYNELLESNTKNHSTSKYRRTFQQELEVTATIPHSEHCKKTVRAGTLFPALAASIKEQNDMLEKSSAGSMYAEAAQHLKRGGTGLHFAPTIDEMIAEHNHEELIDGYNSHHTSAIPVSSEEQMTYSKEFSRLNKLHAVYDRLVALKNTRKKELEDVKQQFSIRDMLDQEAAATLIAGETAVTEMQEKSLKLAKSLAAGDEINIGYRQLISLCDGCPPFTEYHVKKLESDVLLARQQLKDLKAHRTNMYIEAQRIESIKKREIYDKYRYYRTARHDVAIKKRNFMRNSEAKGYPIPILERRPSPSHRMDIPRSPKSLKGVSYSDDSTDRTGDTEDRQKILEAKAIMHIPEFMKNFSEKANKKRDLVKSIRESDSEFEEFEIIPHSKESFVPAEAKNEVSGTPPISSAPSTSAGKKKKDKDSQINSGIIEIIDKTELAKSAISAFANLAKTPLQKALENAKKVQSKMTVDYIAEKTGFHTAEELIDRYNVANKMAENLRSHQILADSRLAQLRAEYTELYSSLGDSYYLAIDESGSGSGTDDSVTENDSRYLDNKLFASEMRLNHLKKQQEKVLYVLNEVKMGICHIISLLQANNKMLSSLPRVSPPRVVSDADLSTAISWVEERVLAINEAMMLESSKPIANNSASAAPIDAENQGMSNRQNELASVVMNSIVRRRGGFAPLNTNTKKKKAAKSAGGMAKNIIDIAESQGTFVSSPRNVMIVSTNEIDKNFDDKMKRLDDKRDKRAQLLEQLEGIDNNINAVKGVTNFVNESLHSSESMSLLRKANIVANKKQGRFAGLGYAMEDVLKSKGSTYLAAAIDIAPKPSVHLANSIIYSTQKKKASHASGESKVDRSSISSGSVAEDDGTFVGAQESSEFSEN